MPFSVNNNLVLYIIPHALLPTSYMCFQCVLGMLTTHVVAYQPSSGRAKKSRLNQQNEYYPGKMEAKPKLKGHFKLLFEWNHDIKIDKAPRTFSSTLLWLRLNSHSKSFIQIKLPWLIFFFFLLEMLMHFAKKDNYCMFMPYAKLVKHYTPGVFPLSVILMNVENQSRQKCGREIKQKSQSCMSKVHKNLKMEIWKTIPKQQSQTKGKQCFSENMVCKCGQLSLQLCSTIAETRFSYSRLFSW